MQDLTEIRDLIQNAHRGDERKLIAGLIEEAEISAEVRK